jgi:hypothetical protein
MTKHVTGDSEIERDLRKMKTAPQALTERTMTDFMRDDRVVSPRTSQRACFGVSALLFAASAVGTVRLTVSSYGWTKSLS